MKETKLRAWVMYNYVDLPFKRQWSKATVVAFEQVEANPDSNAYLITSSDTPS